MITNRRLWSMDCDLYKLVEATVTNDAVPAAVANRIPGSSGKFMISLNISDGYALAFSTGAREHLQNWFDQCMLGAESRQPRVLQYASSAFAAVAEKMGLRSDIIVYAAVNPTISTLLGNLSQAQI